MKRIHWHWTGGTYKANNTDKKAYHELFEGDGKRVSGVHPIKANSSSRGKLTAGTYAAHTKSANTDAIGLSMCCMGGSGVSERAFGKYPVTEAQFEAMMRRTAELCVEYKIPVGPKTTLSHAEVQPNLGIAQAGKWDFTVLPFMPHLKGAKACGDYARERVRYHMSKLQGVTPETPKTEPKPTTHKVVANDTWWYISRHYGLPVETLLHYNNAKASDILHIGRIVYLTPPPKTTKPTPVPQTNTFWQWLVSLFTKEK